MYAKRLFQFYCHATLINLKLEPINHIAKLLVSWTSLKLLLKSQLILIWKLETYQKLEEQLKSRNKGWNRENDSKMINDEYKYPLTFILDRAANNLPNYPIFHHSGIGIGIGWM